MAFLPSLTTSQQPTANPRLYASINGNFFPTKSGKVEQTSYGIADTIEVVSALADLPYDLGAISQQQTPCPMTVQVGYTDPNGNLNYIPLINGFVNEIDNDYLPGDTISVTGRGILSNLIDARISIRPLVNSTITQVISDQISKYKLTPKVASSDIKVGAVLGQDFVGLSRNLKVLDFIHMLCRTAGWSVRAVGNTIVVGPPPDPNATPVLKRSLLTADFLTMSITHNALHNRNIKVKVVSYVQGTKSRGNASKQGPIAAMLGLPVPVSTTSTTRSGNVSGSTSAGERDNVEEYVIPIPNLTQQMCDDRATQLAAEINRHEFVANGSMVLTLDDLKTIMQNSPDINMQLSGCSQPCNNGLYFAKHLTWTWDMESPEGLLLGFEMVNHPIPAPTGTLVNSSPSTIPG